MRVESKRPLKNGGWLHKSGGGADIESSGRGRSQPKNQAVSVSPANFSGLIDRWRKEKAGELEPLAATLGVKQQDLVDLHACWAPDYRAFAFPMFDADGNVVGIRLRNEQFKWSVKGSHPGLFIPFSAMTRMPLDLVLVTEGPTDTAAALALGFFAIGRPSCRGSEQLVIDVLQQLTVKKVVVVYDNDEHFDKRGQLVQPGVRGADTLRKMIPWPFQTFKFIPPTKDLREFLTIGGTRELLLSVIGVPSRITRAA